MNHKYLTLSFLPIALISSFYAECNNPSQIPTRFDIRDFGAVADTIFDSADAIQKAIDHCARAGGGTVEIPAGKSFMCGPIHLASNVELHLAQASRLLANPDESIYNESAFGENRGEGMMWISGKDLHNVSITGNGCLDGNGVAFMGKELDDSYELKPVSDFDPRPHLLTLVNVDNLRIRDVTFRNSAYWTVHLVGCRDVAVSDISILNNLKIRNGDGIDIDHSKKVRISGAFIESGDDCICLKNRREYEEYGSCNDIVVSNCIMTSRSCAVKIGSENMDSISNVVFTNCIITDSNRGIGIQNRDEGTVTDVTFSNFHIASHLYSDVWWGKSEPIYITSYPRATGNHKDAGWRFPKGEHRGRCGDVSGIRFFNISCSSENGVFIGADSVGRVNDISFSNISITLRRTSSWPLGVYDRRPCEGEGFVASSVYGFYLENASDIFFDNCRVSLSGFPKDSYGGLIFHNNCPNLNPEGIR